MTLEEKISNEITWAEAAKGMSSYLHITHPTYPKPKKGLKDRIADIIYAPFFAVIGWWGRDKELEKQTEQIFVSFFPYHARMYKEMGLVTPQEKCAFTVAQFIGLHLSNITNYGNESLKLSKDNFEKMLNSGINAGVMILKSQSKIVNPDFNDKAKKWLLNEIYANASPENELKLLERVSLTLDDKGNFYLR